jgi:hypothetical protein
MSVAVQVFVNTEVSAPTANAEPSLSSLPSTAAMCGVCCVISGFAIVIQTIFAKRSF